ncbi:hypothetical protein APHAL10511_003627 [Amanita phalloides]|nr:hypothetical protein APHAL10511_003627 [Amanita phalloides]
MFWGEDDLYELEGTAVVEKIGKDEANQEYNTKIVAALQSRMDLFHPDAWAKDYSLEMFHMMGSCILSRSFNVEPWHNMNTGSENKSDVEDDAMSDSSQDSDSQEESDAEGSSSIAMVPMADMLNARFGSENSKLFHEEDCLRMVTTKSIRAGEQIWNTYGDLPNSELLRRYGHVDLVPLPDGGVGNPGDVIEIQVDIVVEAVLKHHPTPSSAESRERIDWWLDNGGDDAIVIESDYEVPAVMLSLIRLFLLSKSEWEKTKIKSKPPKAKMEPDVIQVLITILQQRMKKYPSGLNDDESLLRQAISLNKKQAIVVRMGEKRILKKTLDKLQVMTMAEGNATKRKRVDNDGANRVKSRK